MRPFQPRARLTISTRPQPGPARIEIQRETTPCFTNLLGHSCGPPPTPRRGGPSPLRARSHRIGASSATAAAALGLWGPSTFRLAMGGAHFFCRMLTRTCRTESRRSWSLGGTRSAQPRRGFPPCYHTSGIRLGASGLWQATVTWREPGPAARPRAAPSHLTPARTAPITNMGVSTAHATEGPRMRGRDMGTSKLLAQGAGVVVGRGGSFVFE